MNGRLSHQFLRGQVLGWSRRNGLRGGGRLLSSRRNEIFLFKLLDGAGLNLDDALAGLQPDDWAIDAMAVGMETKAVGEHNELAGLRCERNRNKRQHELH